MTFWQQLGGVVSAIWEALNVPIPLLGVTFRTVLVAVAIIELLLGVIASLGGRSVE